MLKELDPQCRLNVVWLENTGDPKTRARSTATELTVAEVQVNGRYRGQQTQGLV